MKRILELINKIFGPKKVSQHIGTKTGVKIISAGKNNPFKGIFSVEKLKNSPKALAEAKKQLENNLGYAFSNKNTLELQKFEKNLEAVDAAMNPKSADIIPIKKQKDLVRRPEEFVTRKEYERYLDETLGPPDDVFGSPIKEDLLKEWDKVKAKDVTPKKLTKTDEGIKSTQEYKDIVEELRKSGIGNKYAGDDLEKAALDILKIRNKNKIRLEGEIDLKTFLKSDAEREFLGFPNRKVEATVRTAARDVLEKAGLGPRIKGQDPIDMARQIYGDEILYALDNIVDELQEASGSYAEISRILKEKKIYDFKPKQGLNVKQKGEIEDITAFDPKDRTLNAEGGLIDILKL